MPTISTTWSTAPAGWPSGTDLPLPGSASSLSRGFRSAPPAQRTCCASHSSENQGSVISTCRLGRAFRETQHGHVAAKRWVSQEFDPTYGLNISPVDLVGQLLDQIGDVLEMRMDGKRAAQHLER